MMRMGAWEVDFSGNVNGFVTFIDCDDKGDGVVAAGLACGSNGNDRDVNNIQTGLFTVVAEFSTPVLFTDSGVKNCGSPELSTGD